MKLTRAKIEKVYGVPFIDGNSVELIGGAKDTFGRIFDMLSAARRCICLEFYIFRNDETGEDISRILMQKAREGVDVYMLYDHYGSFGTPRSFWSGLRSAGIRVRASHPFKVVKPLSYMRRDHRKLIIVDGATSFTGGLNIANEYRRFHLRGSKKRKPWRDTAIMIKGPASVELFERFKRTWAVWGGRRIKHAALPVDDAGELPLIPIFAHSVRGSRQMRKLLYYCINNSTESIMLTTAYFTPSRRMLETLEGAVRRGARARLLVPEKSDVRAVDYAGRAFFTRLLKAGVEIYTYGGEMLHAKSYVFDCYFSIVGSANLDFRSLRWNDEGNVGIADRGFGLRAAEMFEHDISRSNRVDLEMWRRRPLSEKLKEWFFAQFRMRL